MSTTRIFLFGTRVPRTEFLWIRTGLGLAFIACNVTWLSARIKVRQRAKDVLFGKLPCAVGSNYPSDTVVTSPSTQPGMTASVLPGRSISSAATTLKSFAHCL